MMELSQRDLDDTSQNVHGGAGTIFVTDGSSAKSTFVNHLTSSAGLPLVPLPFLVSESNQSTRPGKSSRSFNGKNFKFRRTHRPK